MKDTLLSTTQAGKMLGLSPEAIRKYVRIGKLRGYKLGYNVVRIPQSEVDRLLSEGETGKDTELPRSLAG